VLDVHPIAVDRANRTVRPQIRVSAALQRNVPAWRSAAACVAGRRAASRCAGMSRRTRVGSRTGVRRRTRVTCCACMGGRTGVGCRSRVRRCARMSRRAGMRRAPSVARAPSMARRTGAARRRTARGR
jgi:hypothetical protein